MKSDAVFIETVHGVRQEVSIAELQRARQFAAKFERPLSPAADRETDRRQNPGGSPSA